MVMDRQEPAQRVNIFVPNPLFDGERADLMRRGAREDSTASDYRRAREAAAYFESHEVTRDRSDPALIRQVVQSLGRGGFAMASLNGDSDENTYNLAEGGLVGPPEDATIVIPEIGLVSVPAGGMGEQSVTRAEAAISSLAAAMDVEPAVIMRALVTDLAAEPSEYGVADQPLDLALESAGDEWFEAMLETGALAETLPCGVSRVGAPAAWARGYRGQGVRVAIIDTGVGPHVDLPAPVASATFVPNTNSANDDNGHGTHVAGTVLARRNGIGVVGVAPLALLMRAKVLSRTGSGTDTGVAAGIVWAANNGAKVINMSLGGGFSTAIQRAIIYARGRGVTICAAGGNEGCGKPVTYPGRDPLAIGVAAVDCSNRKASFSCCGPELDLSAPGVDILSTYPTNSYRKLNGTSMATPHVSGVAALVLSKRPGLTPAQVQAILERTAIPLGPVNQFGRGLVQAGGAVAIAEVDSLSNGASPQPTNGWSPEQTLAGAGRGPRGRN